MQRALGRHFLRRLSVVVALMTVLGPVGASASSEVEGGGRPADFTVFQSGGLDAETISAVERIVAQVGARSSVVRSGSLRLMGVLRGEDVVQEFAPGYGVPMATIAYHRQMGPLMSTRLREALSVENGIVMSQRSADLRGAEVGDRVEIEGWDLRMYEFVIADILPDESLDWYELVISMDVADQIEFQRESRIVVWDVVAGDLARMMLGAVDRLDGVGLRVEGETRVTVDATLATVEQKQRFGEFSFRRAESGDFIVIDPDWVESNIVSVSFPETGVFRCHRAIIPYFRSALNELRELGLATLIDRSDFQAAGGCYVPRMQRGGDKGFAISRHAWGTSVDINPSTNRYGGTTALPEEFGEVMRRWGFAWGAGWTTPDGMHFEWKQIPPEPERHACAPVRIGTSAAGTVEIEYLDGVSADC